MKQVNQATIDEYLSEAEEILDTVADELISLEETASQGDPDAEVVNAIFRGAHSLKGISAMFGFDDITEVAHKLENLLDAIRMGKVACDRPVLDLLFEGIDVIKGLCAKLLAEGSTHDASTKLYVDRLLAAVEGRGPAASEEGEEDGPLTMDDVDLAQETLNVLTDYELHRIEACLADQRKSLAGVHVALSLFTLDTEMEKVTGAIKPLGEVISTLPDAGEVKPDELDFMLIVAFKTGLAEAAQALEPLNCRVASLLKPRQKRAKLPPAPKPAANPTVRFDDVEAESPLPAAPPAPAQGREEARRHETPRREAGEDKGDSDLRSMSKTIRVDLTKLDLLMNLVGELVLTKGRFLAINDNLRAEFGFNGEVLEMAKAQKELERRLGELQQAVMEVRMVPMGQLFSKLNRVVRKLLQGSAKRVNLEISGSETQLDKLIVEDISDPLIHVIRNSVDHGIESPQDRTLAGKNPDGTISVSALQQGNYVIIEVKDDGGGMDLERIKTKARKLGIIGPDEEPEKKRLLEIVFLPGFSTRDQVSETSGRGVGMDVLRKNVANISGMIELDTERGQGTTVRIILPITLAIIQALLIETAGEHYAIPLNTVMETVVVEEGDLRSLEGRPMLRMREATLPFIDIGHLFGLVAERRTPPYAVIVAIAEKRVAFGVDALLTQRDVVIKSLGARLADLRGISGATDLGDSRTVLILDVAEMIEEVYETT